MDAYHGGFQQPNRYFESSNSQEDSPEVQIEQLKAEVESLKTEVQQYKTVSQSFEKRVLDLHLELMKKDEEISRLKEQNIAMKETDQSSEDFDNEVLRKLFVGGLNFSTTDDMLKEYFSQYGTITESIVMRDPATKKSRGFGFVVFTTAAQLDSAQSARPHTIDGREVDTKRAVPRGEPTKKQPGILAKKIFIGGLKTTTDEATLYQYFSQFGTVDNVDVLEDKATKRKRGFAYVTFTDSDPVDKAVLQKYHTIDGRRCEVKKAFTREEMKNKNAQGSGPVAQQLGNVVGTLLGNIGMGNLGGRHNMGGGICGPQCGNMGGNFGPGGNMCGNFGHGGNTGGNFGNNMGGNFGGNCGHGGNCGPGGNRGGNMDGMGSPGNWGPGGNMGGYCGHDGNNLSPPGGNAPGWNQSGNGSWNQGGGGGFPDSGQGPMGSNWNSMSYGSGSSGGKSGSGKTLRNTYTQRGAGPYGGGYGVSSADQSMPQDSASIRN